MRKYGRLKPGWIGLGVQQVTQEIATAAGLERIEGALISEVVPGSEAAKVLQVGDIVLNVNGDRVPDVREFVRTFHETTPGTPLMLTVYRYGRTISVQTPVQDHPDTKPNPWGEWVMPDRGKRVSSPAMGMRLVPVTDEIITQYNLQDGQKGVAIVAVAANSSAADAGVKAGDVIIQMPDQPVNSPDDLHNAVAAITASGRKSVLVLVRNEKGVRWIAAPVEGE